MHLLASDHEHIALALVNTKLAGLEAWRLVSFGALPSSRGRLIAVDPCRNEVTVNKREERARATPRKSRREKRKKKEEERRGRGRGRKVHTGDIII